MIHRKIKLSVSILLCGIATLAVVADGGASSTATAASQPSSDSTTLPSPEDQAALDALKKEYPDMKYNHVALSDVIDFLRDMSRPNYYVDWRALHAVKVDPLTPITQRFHGKILSDILTDTLTSCSADLKFEIDHGVIVISSAQAFALEKTRAIPDPLSVSNEQNAAGDENSAMETKLARPIADIKFDQIPFSDAIAFLRDLTGLVISTDDAAFKNAGVIPATPITLRLHNVKASTALYFLLKDASAGTLSYHIKNGKVVLVTIDTLKSQN